MPSTDVLDSSIHYRQSGAGRPFVFLHGNPTSSHLWRRVLPAVGDPAWRLAPDLIGMGASGKPDIAYSFADHARYLDAWFDALDLYSRGIVVAAAIGARLFQRPGGLRELEHRALRLAAEGMVVPLTESFDLADAPAAHRAIEGRRTYGKTILLP